MIKEDTYPTRSTPFSTTFKNGSGQNCLCTPIIFKLTKSQILPWKQQKYCYIRVQFWRQMIFVLISLPPVPILWYTLKVCPLTQGLRSSPKTCPYTVLLPPMPLLLLEHTLSEESILQCILVTYLYHTF